MRLEYTLKNRMKRYITDPWVEELMDLFSRGVYPISVMETPYRIDVHNPFKRRPSRGGLKFGEHHLPGGARSFLKYESSAPVIRGEEHDSATVLAFHSGDDYATWRVSFSFFANSRNGGGRWEITSSWEFTSENS